MSLLSRIWWGEDVEGCRHRLWFTRCGRCVAAGRLREVLSEFLTPPAGEADRVARRVRELRAAEDRLDALGVDQDGAA